MSFRDLLSLSLEALLAHRLRYALSALAIAVGVAAVVGMSSLGEGTRRFIQVQASTFGTSIVGINPGKVTTMGIPGAMGVLNGVRAAKRSFPWSGFSSPVASTNASTSD